MEMTADSLTKALGREKHEKCTVRLGMACLDLSGNLLSFFLLSLSFHSIIVSCFTYSFTYPFIYLAWRSVSFT